MNIIEFQNELYEMRMQLYRHPPIDIIKEGFRPVSGSCADFCVIEHEGAYHFFYIERRLKEATPFFPGNEIYFGHASTPDFFNWEVHDPVMLIRPGTWESAHVWAPFILKHGGRYVMAYTGLNEYISQNIGLAFSDDLFNWERYEKNPISPCQGKEWCDWREDRISGCRDPHLLEYEGRIYMTYTTHTVRGEACVAMASTDDLVNWQDHGPILVGPADGYKPSLWGGHQQGSLESSNLLKKGDKWYLIANTVIKDTNLRHLIWESDRMDSFDFPTYREFWRDGGCIEVVKERGSRSLLAGVVGGHIKFGEVDWSEPQPVAHTIASREQLEAWQG